VLELALSTPGNVTTAAIAGVALLLGVLLMARGRRVDAEAGAAVAGPPPEASDAAPHAAAQPDPEPAPAQAATPDPEPPSATSATPDAAAADPAIVAADEAPSEPRRIRLGGARFGETAGQATASEDSEPAPPAESAPAAPNEEEPAGPQRIRLRGARFGPAALEGPAAAPEGPATAEEPPATAEPPASAEPAAGPALEAWRLRARQPEAAAAKSGRIRLGERRFLPATPIAPEPADGAPEPAAPEPADSAPEPAAAPPDAAAPPALPPASGFRQGSIRLRK